MTQSIARIVLRFLGRTGVRLLSSQDLMSFIYFRLYGYQPQDTSTQTQIFQSKDRLTASDNNHGHFSILITKRNRFAILNRLTKPLKQSLLSEKKSSFTIQLNYK